MEDLIHWYENLNKVKDYLGKVDPKLLTVFNDVDKSGFKLYSVIKDPYTALICAIVGQKITYKLAKSLRGQLYSRHGSVLSPHIIINSDLVFLGNITETIIKDVTLFILTYNINLNTEEGIRSLQNVKGIGLWTIETTILISLMNWNIFPKGDKFLQK